MRATLIPVLALVAAGAAFGQSGRLPSSQIQVTAIRHWSLEGVTRVAIETTGEFRFHSERLHNPERIFFDIFRARPLFDGRRIYSKDVGDRLLQRVRVAETLPGVTRIVFDLAGDVEVTASQMANPNRLMVELRAPGKAPAPPAAAPETPAPAAKVEPPPAKETPPPTPKVEPPPARKPAPASAAKVEPPPAPKETPAPKVEPPAPAGREETGTVAGHTADGKSSMVRALGLKIKTVVIDAGHGGHDQGTVGPRGVVEKDLVLDVAKRLGQLIHENLGSEVIYTRTDDTFVPLENRTALANEKKADLFISLHANSSRYARIGGVETFYLNFTSSRDALDVAARENASSQKSISELQDLLQKITLQNKIEESRELAGRLQASMFTFSSRYLSGLRNRGVKKAPFVVLIGAQMPSVLVEIGFLSNTREETLFKRPEHRQRAAEALFRGISRYAQGLSHFQVAAAAGNQ